MTPYSSWPSWQGFKDPGSLLQSFGQFSSNSCTAAAAFRGERGHRLESVPDIDGPPTGQDTTGWQMCRSPLRIGHPSTSCRSPSTSWWSRTGWWPRTPGGSAAHKHPHPHGFDNPDECRPSPPPPPSRWPTCQGGGPTLKVRVPGTATSWAVHLLGSSAASTPTVDADAARSPTAAARTARPRVVPRAGILTALRLGPEAVPELAGLSQGSDSGGWTSGASGARGYGLGKGKVPGLERLPRHP